MHRRSLRHRTVAGATALGLAALGLLGLAGPASAVQHRAVAGTAHQAGATSRMTGYRRACQARHGPGQMACLVLVRTNVTQRSQASLGHGAAPTGVGYGPADLQNAYLLPSASAGSGQTVAIVDAYDDPAAEADLTVYRADWGLPPCTSASGCFTKVNQSGQASPLPAASGSSGWATEESLDLDMVSAICPNCHILLVEANSPAVTDLGTGVNSAVSLGAQFVSNSYGAGEYPAEVSDDAAYYDHPGKVITASAGDSGYGVEFPAASPHVVAVGGTSLTTASGSRGWTETAWDGTGSGCSADEPKPSWQTDSGCANRTGTDVSAVADPNTGVAVYDTYDRSGWLEVGGTSASAPIIAGTYALAGSPAAGSYPASYLYPHAAGLFDVTSGSNGACAPAYLCTAGPGYDGPTGLGTPDGIRAFGQPTGDIITVITPGPVAATQDVPFSLQIRANDSAPGQTLAFTAQGLPPGLSINQSSGLISGTPTAPGQSATTVTATDGTGATGFATFTLTVASPVSLSGPGAQDGYLGQPVLAKVTSADAVTGRTVSFSASGLPGGLSIGPATGAITGLPTAAGYFHPVVTGTDSAGRSASEQFVWYLAAAQAAGRAGPVALAGGQLCLTGRSGATEVQVAGCAGTRGQAWAAQPDGSLRVLGKCLSLTSPKNGAATQLLPCGGTTAEQWRIGPPGELVSVAAGKCLTATGSTVGVWPCGGAAGQGWSAPPGPLVSAVTGLCADSGAGTTGHLQMWYCANTGAQAWTVPSGGSVRIGARCLTAKGTVSGAAVVLASCTGAGSQQWRARPGGTLVNPASGLCLADPGGSAVAGTMLVIGRCAAVPGELWHAEG